MTMNFLVQHFDMSDIQLRTNGINHRHFVEDIQVMSVTQCYFMNIVCVTFKQNKIRRIVLQNNDLKLNDHEYIPPIVNFVSINVVPL